MTSWYCSVCDKTIINKIRSKHNNSNSHKHKKNIVLVFKIVNLLDQTIIR